MYFYDEQCVIIAWTIWNNAITRTTAVTYKNAKKVDKLW